MADDVQEDFDEEKAACMAMTAAPVIIRVAPRHARAFAPGAAACFRIHLKMPPPGWKCAGSQSAGRSCASSPRLQGS